MAFWYKIGTSFFFFFLNNFAFLSWKSWCAMYKFSHTHADIWFRSKFLANLTQWRFGTKLVRVFFFFFSRILHFFLGRLHVLCTSFHAHTLTFDVGQNSWPIWPDGILVQNWYEFFFFFFKEFFISFLDVLMCYVQVFMHTRRHLI